MNKGDAVREAFEAHYGAIATPYTDLAQRAGSNKAAAALLGVTPRTVQRHIAAEGHAPRGGKQARGVAATRAARQAAIAVKGRASSVSFQGNVNIRGDQHGTEYQGYRNSYLDDGDDLDDFWDDVESGDWDAAADDIADEYVGGSDFEDLDSFDFED